VIVRAVDLPAGAIAFWRVAIAATALGAALAVLGRLSLVRPAGQVWPLVRLGVILGVHWLAYFETIKLSSVTLAVLLVYTGPLFIAVLAPRLLGTATSRPTMIALAAGAAGIALVATDGSSAIRVTAAGLAMGVVAGLTFALLIIAGRAVTNDVTAPAFLFWETVVASALLLPVAVVQGPIPADAADVAGLLALGVGATAVLGMVFATALRHVDAQGAGVLMYLEPVSTVVLAWLFLSEQPSLRTVIGGALVLAAGVFTVALREPAATLTGA
jgi:drug/metabolite transporter (DMT)-like permease